jgi:DNA-binding transcriptional MerR regulator
MSGVSTYTPAEAVAKTGFSLDTLRYYEKIGLLRGIQRDTGGRRVFTDADLGWLGILRCLRDTGMPINQMQRYADLTLQDGSIDERLEILIEHDRAISEQLAELHRYREHLRQKIAYYQGVREQRP